MCKLLGISRSIVYYNRKNKRKDMELENHIIRIFKESKKRNVIIEIISNIYGVNLEIS